MKNLKASEAVDCSTDFEILRYAQDDRERVQDDRERVQNDRERVFWMTERVLRMTVDRVWSARRSFATLRMTEREFRMTYYIV